MATGGIQKVNWDDKLKRWEKDVQEGRLAQGQHELFRLTHLEVPDRHRSQVARLLRRSGQALKGLKILTPIVLDPESQMYEGLPNSTLVEYAALIKSMGLVQEARALLDQVNTKEFPEALLIRSFCHFAYWDYASARPDLEAYVGSRISDYQKLVGKINLLACHLQLKELGPAESLFNELEKQIQPDGNLRLWANLLELKTQWLIHSEDLDQATQVIDEARKTLSEDTSLDRVFADKWVAFIKAKKTKSLEPLRAFHKKAKDRGHWETLRQLDFLMQLVEPDQERIQRLYFGSPNPLYRKVIEEEFGFQPEQDFVDVGPEKAPVLDVFEGQLDGRELISSPGGYVHRFLWSVFFDIYKPRMMAQVFSMLYPEEHFNVFSSPDKVHQLASRLRKDLNGVRDADLFDSSEFGYLPVLQGKFRFRIYLDRRCPTQSALYMKSLVESGASEFSRTDIENRLSLSSAGLTRFLRQATEEGYLSKQKSGRTVIYKLKKPSP